MKLLKDNPFRRELNQCFVRRNSNIWDNLAVVDNAAINIRMHASL